MFGGMNSSLSVPVVAGLNNNGNGYGMDGGWWAWILLFALFGWGGNGFGFGNNGGGVGAEVQRGFDTQSIISKLDGINNGICSLGYDQLAQMNGINSTIMQTGFGLQGTMQNNAIAAMQQANALQAQIQDCCCEGRAAVAQLRYDMASDTCAVTGAIDKLGDRIEGRLTAMEMAQKNETIAMLRQQLNDCGRDAALQGTASYIINAVRPTAQPAYLTCNPQTGLVWPQTQGGCCGNWNNGCGCN